ncbi:MAG: hypothetical protein PHI37_04010 [Candidatus Gracilibacteria bacterium]|nr:hypothetical protein [Candidatus Gracilibacteria bacterium]
MFKDEKTVEIKVCKHCNSNFEITDKDLEFYEKVSPVFSGKKYLIPSPALCPDCRQQRRLSFFNQTNLYKNTCNNCGKNIISRFNSENGIKNYCNECWSSENWDQLKNGKDFDFSKTVFNQLDYLIKNTPFQNLIGSSSNIINNSIYTNHTSEIHNSYLVFEANSINDCMYSYALKNSKNIVDSSFVGNSENCYECSDSYNMFNSFYCQKSYGSKFSYFLNNCYNCDYCIGCVNLNNKSYYYKNQPISKNDYEKIIKNLANINYLIIFKREIYDFFSKNIVKNCNIIGSEDCIGNNIINSKKCINSFDILECENLKYCVNINYSKDLYDITAYGEESNRMYESLSVGRYSNNILFSNTVGKGEKLIYCIDVKKSKNCFLCVNLEGKEYCILNKQYTKEEYEQLVPKIIEHMQKTGEWGEFFPSSISPFGYNETVAQEYFPISHSIKPSSPTLLSKVEGGLEIPLPLGEVRGGQRTFNRSTYEAPFPKVEKIIKASMLPEDISKIPDDILNRAIECEVSGKPFKIIKQELEFYRKHNLPIPKRHPDQRHLDRMSLRNPRKLFDRKCDKCGKDIKTTYSPDRKEIVYCEECYDKEIY